MKPISILLPLITCIIASAFSFSDLRAAESETPQYSISPFTGAEIPYDVPALSAPKTGIFYIYSGETLITEIPIKEWDDEKNHYYVTQHEGNVHWDKIDGFTKNTLRKGALGWVKVDKATNVDTTIAKLYADIIVWYDKEK